MQNVRKLLPFIIIVCGLLLAGLISFSSYTLVNHQSRQVQGASAIILAPEAVEPSALPIVTPKPITTRKPLSSAQLTHLTAPVSPTTTPIISQTVPSTATPSPTSELQKITLSLSIDGGSPFTLSIGVGKNHCDVLTEALNQGKIVSLNMQYDPAFSSYGVYQINGLGQEGQVWWTYFVNEKSPPLGCSHVSVQPNDNVRWTYIGPR